MITENLSTLKIHKLTQEQYDRELASDNLDENALYLTPDEDIDLSGYVTTEQLNGKADISHNHDDLYYTIAQVDEILVNKSDDDHNHDEEYDIKGAADEALNSAKAYTDTTKNTILGEVVNDRDSLKKLSDLIDGTTSNMQTQLDEKSPSNHTHTEYIVSTNPVGTGSFSMNRKADSTIGNYSHAEGKNATASGSFSHAEGNNTTASGMCSHAEGLTTTASEDCSHAEGDNTTASGVGSHAEGSFTTASGSCSHAEGSFTTASGNFSHAEGYSVYALDHQHVQGHYNNLSTTAGVGSGTSTGAAFVIGNGTEESGSNAFRVTYEGKPYASSSVVTTGADYAEFFEWLDLNSNAEDRRGYFVTLDEDKIKIAEPNDYILGIVSALPAVIGNGDECWRGRYILDDFGAFIIEEFEYEEEIFDKESDEIKTITKTGTKYKENPDYDPTTIYIQREDRPEWDTVGMMGVLAVRDDGTCKVNGYCKVAEGGIATASETGYRVIKRINDNIIKVVFR